MGRSEGKKRLKTSKVGFLTRGSKKDANKKNLSNEDGLRLNQNNSRKLTMTELEELINQSSGQAKRIYQKMWVEQFKEIDPKGYEKFLKQTDLKAYEAHLKETDPNRYLDYLQETDPEGYEAYLNHIAELEDAEGEMHLEQIKDTTVNVFNLDGPRNTD